MTAGSTIRKLSLQVKERLTLKRRKRSNSTTTTTAAEEYEIAHPHFNNSLPPHAPAVRTRSVDDDCMQWGTFAPNRPAPPPPVPNKSKAAPKIESPTGVSFPRLSDDRHPQQQKQQQAANENDDREEEEEGLDEILFATNARVDAETRATVRGCIDSTDVSQHILADFDSIVAKAYRDFTQTALQILTKSHHSKSISEIVATYTAGQYTSGRPPPEPLSGSMMGAAADEVGELALELHRRDISEVKYSLDQLRRYAATGLCKYVTSQVLLSTGVENDLVDKLEEAAGALSCTMDQIDILQGLDGAGAVEKEDIRALREKAAAHRRAVDRLKAEGREAGVIRETFEEVLLAIQVL
ncbi:hypothetical protein BX661DRAFT_206197 [Kickxella alabastrina]|uniref:uncharacterized protein n=1 Tax=Kickxella alabastrina TaxID=61397 RepID=UPI0022201751|nr:uncharacterized protein BX661DRAFT_206197 [Kickxella alabastrina]KAI7825923.1 hypothetical protein BX661DRAFT_206197 [Kickxella alabastrina]KAJ1947187.1 hypothetical protein GGF37_000642 [Kickxella alabastrina]